MADKIAAFIDHSGLGHLTRRVPLTGKLRLNGGAKAHAELCLTPGGLYVVAALDGENGTAIDLLRRDDVRWEPATMSGKLKVGDVVLGTAPGRSDAVSRSMALARLRKPSQRTLEPSPPSRYVEAPDETEQTFLAGLLDPDELLIAFVASATRLPIRSTWLSDTEGELRLIMTERRLMLVALSPVGDVRQIELGREPFSTRRRRARSEVVSGAERWVSTFTNGHLFEELAAIVPLEPIERILEVGIRNFVDRTREPVHGAVARRLFEIASERGSATARAALALVVAEGKTQLEASELIARLRSAGAAPTALADLFERLQSSLEAGRTLVAALRELGADAEPWALELHDKLYAETRRRERDPFVHARADVALAEHRLMLGEREPATTLLEARLGELPHRPIEELVPARDADLTQRGSQALAVKIHELLAEARRAPSGPDPRSLAELARLEPLVLSRIRALAASSDGELARRAIRALKALEPAGVEADVHEEPAPATVLPLTAASLERRLRHPLVREGEELLGQLQALLAAVPMPDHEVLHDYCEQLSPDRHSAAARALSDAAHALGVSGVRAYISRGNKSFGLRAYEGQPPFVLIGVRHLEPDNEHGMSEHELRFAIAMEVAHLRYGHARVTSSEVWAGAWIKSKQGLDFALGVLPMFKGFRFADRIGRIVSRVPIDPTKRLVDKARSLGEKLRGASEHAALPHPEGLSRVNEELIAANRVMQLTADRAGLLLAGDLRAALRAILLVRSDYRALLDDAERLGLDVVLGRRDATGEIQYQDLAIRSAALVSFFLSDDYAGLRAELLGTSGGS